MATKIITISGASGAGKSTIVKAQLNWIPGLVTLVSSTTTRNKRPTDLPGEYEYVTRPEFDAYEAEGAFLWSVEVGGEEYGTKKTVLDETLFQDKKIGLMIVTPDTVPILKRYASKKFGYHEGVYSIHIVTVTYKDKLSSRMQQRGDSQDLILKRLQDSDKWDKWALRHYRLFDLFITNEESIEETASFVLQKIIERTKDKNRI